MNYYDLLIEHGIATEDEIELVTNVAGASLDVFEGILYSRTGLQSFDQLEGEGD